MTMDANGGSMASKKNGTPGLVVDAAPRTIQASTFKATCLELMEEVAARHIEIVVTKHGRPVMKVGPVDPMPPSPLGFLRNTLIGQSDVVGPEHDVWREPTSDPLDVSDR
jgi:prevent-host-death family protein